MRVIHLLALVAALAPTVALAAPLYGANLSGLEMGSGPVANTNYAVPDPSALLAQHLQVIRVPFTLERLQPHPGQPLDPAYLGYVSAIAAKDAAAGAWTVLDPHDYGYDGSDGTSREIGVDATGTAEYLDAMTRLATAFAHAPLVAIGLMNEPHDQTCAQLAPVWQQAITPIRGAGFGGPVMVPGTGWDGAASFVGSGCDTAFPRLTDPAHDLVVEVHSYLDPDGSGTYAQPVASPTIGVQRLAPVIAWAKSAGMPLFLGETGSPPDAASVAALSNELTALAASPQAWGVTLWAAGPWWPASYPMSLNPTASGVTAPQLAAMEAMMPPPPNLVLTLAEDAWQGDAAVQVTLDGKPIAASPVTITAHRAAGAAQSLTIPGPFASGPHTVRVAFTNDAYGGSAAEDRNAFVLSASYAGALLGLFPASLLSTGDAASVAFTAP